MICRAPLVGGPFCPSCGAGQPDAPATHGARDPLLGAILADRYEILDVISAGGMGRVYRALQRPLDRVVAIKVVDPEVVPTVTAGELAARFLTEARAASRLNHPNVISIYDFGQATSTPGAPLFLVMEHLTGPTLASVLDRGEGGTLARIVAVLGQVLAALAEAHGQGIVHRDVKPSNVVLEPIGGEERVKVIDFGVARIAAERRVTQEGQIMGTPQYIAPELVMQRSSGPSVDLYAVGVMLFEMLTGHVPFDDPSPTKVLELHATAPRPDPREVAPERAIPAALAEVCVRALAVDPPARYPDARALSRAIADAALATVRSEAPLSRGARGAVPHAPTVPVSTSESVARVRLAARASSPNLLEMPLVGRDEQLARVATVLASPGGVAALVIRGRTGTGRTRMLGEIAAEAERKGALVAFVPSEPQPVREVGYGCLRALVRELAGERAARPGDAVEPLVAEGLARILGGAAELPAAGSVPPAARKGARDAAVAALAWAAQIASDRARGALVVALVDDVDSVDGASRAAIAELLERGGAPGLLFALACEELPARFAAACVETLDIVGLTRAEAKQLASGGARVSSPGERPGSEPGGTSRRIEPLFLEHFARWRSASPGTRPPATLEAIVEARIVSLTAEELHLLQAIAVAGAPMIVDLGHLLPRDEGVHAALTALMEQGFVEEDRGAVRVTHALYGRTALQSASVGAVEELHARAAGLAGDVERRAYHAIRGGAAAEAATLAVRASNARAARGDDDGAVAVLEAAFSVARRRIARGDGDAASTGWLGLAEELGRALVDAGRVEHAHGVLVEALSTVGPGAPGRAAILEQLGRVAGLRGRHGEAARWLREAETAVDEEEAGPRGSLRRMKPEPTTATRARPAAFAVREEVTASSSRPSRIVPREDEDEEPEEGTVR